MKAKERVPGQSWRYGSLARGGTRALLLSPALIWVFVLVLAPNLFLLVNSFWRNRLGTIIHDFSLYNYQRAFTSEIFQALFVRTFVIATVASVVATLIAYPAAYLVVRRFGRWKLTAALLIMVPLWVSYLMRVFAWRIILGERGILNGILTSLGILGKESEAFLYSKGTVTLTLTYIVIPYVFLAAYTSLERIPESLYEASADCGGGPLRTFWHIIWPLSRPGVAIGFAIGFVLAFGDYISPAMVGGMEGTMLGSIIIQQFGIANNWPFGAAIGVSIMLSALLFLSVVSLFSRTEARFD